MSVLLGIGDGTFAAQSTYPAGGSPRSFTSGDFNGDGQTDLATANYTDGVSVLLGAGDGTFGVPTTFMVLYNLGRPISITTGDFNGDGFTDLATSTRSTINHKNVSVLMGVGDGNFGSEAIYESEGGRNSINTGDFNGDGITDLVIANGYNNSFSVLPGVGDGTLVSQTTYLAGDGALFVTRVTLMATA